MEGRGYFYQSPPALRRVGPGWGPPGSARGGCPIASAVASRIGAREFASPMAEVHGPPSRTAGRVWGSSIPRPERRTIDTETHDSLTPETPTALPPSAGQSRVLPVVGKLLGFALMVVVSCTMAVPFVWMVTASFKPRNETDGTHLVPHDSQPGNYLVVLRYRPDPHMKKELDLNFPRWYFNSLFIATFVTTLQVLTSAMAAYAFSRIRWPGRDKIFLLYLATMMIPGLVLMIPNYQIMVSLNLVNSYAGLIIPAAFSAFGTFLLRQFMMTIPPSMDEAAEIDGAGHIQIFLDVILPLARPGLITLTIFTFLGNYQSFFWPLVMIKDDHLRTLPIGMLAFQTTYGQQTEYLMAATVMCVVPLIVLFILLQKRLVAGIQLGAVKG